MRWTPACRVRCPRGIYIYGDPHVSYLIITLHSNPSPYISLVAKPQTSLLNSDSRRHGSFDQCDLDEYSRKKMRSRIVRGELRQKDTSWIIWMTLTVRDVDRSSYPTQCRVSSDSTRTLVNRVLCECVHSSLCSHHWGGLLLFLLKRAHARPHWPRLCASMRERIQGAASGCYKECGRQLVRVIACRGRWTHAAWCLSLLLLLSLNFRVSSAQVLTTQSANRLLWRHESTDGAASGLG